MAETFPQVHHEPNLIRIHGSKDSHPIGNVHLILMAGNTHRDLHLGMWHEDALTDEHGKARLGDALANLPFLQIKVAKRHMCQADSGSATYSIERIRRDGFTTSNRCGTATVETAPGVFAVFVKGKRVASKAARHAPSIPARKN